MRTRSGLPSASQAMTSALGLSSGAPSCAAAGAAAIARSAIAEIDLMWVSRCPRGHSTKILPELVSGRWRAPQARDGGVMMPDPPSPSPLMGEGYGGLAACRLAGVGWG